jgi:hypothetical protein
MSKYQNDCGRDTRFLGPPIRQPSPTRHPPIQMWSGNNMSGLGCCDPSAERGAPAGATRAARAFDFSKIPDWAIWGAVAVGAYLLLKK